MPVENISIAKKRLQNFSANKKWYRRFCKRSAVALILHQGSRGLDVMMIKRAEREGDPWSGHMAFPGGKAESSDNNNYHTATRETWEEVGFNLNENAMSMGRLSDVMFTHHRRGRPMVITPYVFTVDEKPEFQINQEVAEVVWVPLAFLVDRNNRETMRWQRKSLSLNLPCYFYQDRRIWGLSLSMIDELLHVLKP